MYTVQNVFCPQMDLKYFLIVKITLKSGLDIQTKGVKQCMNNVFFFFFWQLICLHTCVDLVHLSVYVVQQVIPKAEIIRLGVLEQSKEEVIVQVGAESRPWKSLHVFRENKGPVWKSWRMFLLVWLESFISSEGVGPPCFYSSLEQTNQREGLRRFLHFKWLLLGRVKWGVFRWLQCATLY